MAPAVFDLPDGARLLLFAAAEEGSGGCRAAGGRRRSQSGICLLDEVSARGAAPLAAAIAAHRRPGDTVIVSLHWGGNWATQSAATSARLRMR